MSHYKDLLEEEALKAQEKLTIEQTLNQRGSRYGEFHNHAALSQTLKNSILQHYFYTHGQADAPQLPPYMVEGISMICHKLARIANGDPFYIDSWRDISGFSELVAKQLQETEGATDSRVTNVRYTNGQWQDTKGT